MSDLKEKVAKAIDRLKTFCPDDGYYLAFSGGKDSVVCKALLDMSGCKYDATYRVTSVDPPELVKFIKEKHPDVIREVPRYSETIRDKNLRGKPITMWNLIPKEKYPPTRLSRYCCRNLKESGGDGRITVTGVRWAESINRQNNSGLFSIRTGKGVDEKEFSGQDYKTNKSGGVILTNDNDDTRRMIETCYKRHKTNLNPIIEWSDQDVWNFIKSESIPYCSLYDDGFQRLGCIGCPMANKAREAQFKRWPSYKQSYINAFGKMLIARENAGLHQYEAFGESGDDVFNWWMGYKQNKDQTEIEFEEEDG